MANGVHRRFGYCALQNHYQLPSRFTGSCFFKQLIFEPIMVNTFQRVACILTLALSVFVSTGQAQQTDKPQTNILILVGPSTHPPGSHEVAAGGRLVAHCLERAENVPGIQAEVITAWPDDRQKL